MNYLEFWYEALRSERGIVIETDNTELLRQYLYRARRDAGDVELEGIAAVISPLTGNEIWLIKKNAKTKE